MAWMAATGRDPRGVGVDGGDGVDRRRRGSGDRRRQGSGGVRCETLNTGSVGIQIARF